MDDRHFGAFVWQPEDHELSILCASSRSLTTEIVVPAALTLVLFATF